MRSYVETLLILLATTIYARAEAPLRVDSVRLARNGELVQLVIDVSIGHEQPKKDAFIVLTPRLIGSNDSVDFPQIIAYGRNAYYHDRRQGTEPEGISPEAFKIRHKDGPMTARYARTIGHQPWMENSRLKLILTEGTPCDGLPGTTTVHPGFVLPPPDTTYVEHRNKEQDELTGSVSGQARIQFIVNRTDFNPELQNNKQELEQMHQSILEVQQNPNVRITKYRIKGYASPEGSYTNNERLAEGRTERLREFMVDQWGVPADQVEIDYEPEDWQGFRKYLVEHHDEYADADAILEIIDSDLQPDPKLARISSRHAASYRRLHADCFPALRRTDYAINYDWLEIVEREGRIDRDTIITPVEPKKDDLLQDDTFAQWKASRPWMALKTNLLFDLLLTPNVEIEIPLGKDSRWSIMVEDWFPWFLHNKKDKLQIGRYISPGNFMHRYAYELWTLGGELRYWSRPKCQWNRPMLSGSFFGAYGAWGKYDWEWDSTGDQGEFISAGVTIGHSWVLSRHWNFELSASAGAVWGPRRHYRGEFDDTHLIWKYTKNLFYVGPTKLKASLVWLVPSFKRDKRTQQKGGRP